MPFAAFASAGCSRLLYNKSTLGLVMAAGVSINNASSRFRATTATDCEASSTTKRPTVNLQQRMTAIGRFSVLSETEHNPSIITFFMPVKGEPLTKASLVQLWKDRCMMEKHPRFAQALSSQTPGYFEPQPKNVATTTRESDLVSSHVSEALYPVVDFKKEIQTRISELQKSQWDLADSLWQIYVAPGRTSSHLLSTDPKGKHREVIEDTDSLLIFRGHHALADGASMGAALMDLVDEAEDLRRMIISQLHLRTKKVARTAWQRFCYRWKQLVWLVTGSFRAFSYQAYLLYCAFVEPNPWLQLKEEESASVLSSLDDIVSNRPRTVSWTGAAAPVDQVRWVARELSGPRATINDVFVSCVTAALAKQISFHRQRLESLHPQGEAGVKPLPKQRFMHVSVPVHLKGGVVLPGESVGNNLGAFVVRLPGETEEMTPVERLTAVHAELAAMKRTPTPLLSNMMAKALSYGSYVLPSSLTSWLFEKANAGSVAVVTNTRGPTSPVHLGGRRIESFYGFIPLPAGLPVGVVVSSYAGNMILTVTAESWAVPDGDQFLAWILESYLDLLNAASQKVKQKAAS